MISIQTLLYLSRNKIKDAQVLFKNKRYSAAIYLAGYAVEIALKYKICLTLQFNKGFPESKQELQNYQQQLNQNLPAHLTINIRQIKTHNLSDLLNYSGVELKIKNYYLKEWAIATQWNPENRYKKKRVLESNAKTYLASAKKIINQMI